MYRSIYQKFVNFKFTDQELGASGKRGVAIYVNEDLETEEIKLQGNYKDHVWTEIRLRNNDGMYVFCNLVVFAQALKLFRQIEKRVLIFTQNKTKYIRP